MLDMHRPIILGLAGSAYGLKAPSQPAGRSVSAGGLALREGLPRPNCFAIVVARAVLSTAERTFPSLSRMTTSDLADTSTNIEGPAVPNALESVRRSPFWKRSTDWVWSAMGDDEGADAVPTAMNTTAAE
jgi:hypothetical protein